MTSIDAGAPAPGILAGLVVPARLAASRHVRSGQLGCQTHHASAEVGR